MKILVANPNTSAGVTDKLVASGRLVASAGTELIPMTAPRGVPYIATRAEAAIGSAVLSSSAAAQDSSPFAGSTCTANRPRIEPHRRFEGRDRLHQAATLHEDQTEAVVHRSDRRP